MQIALNEHKRPTATTIQYGKFLEMNLRKAKQRLGSTSDPKGDQRAVRDAQVAMDTFNETMSRLLLDCEVSA
jgi:hypothetical protein